MSSLDEELRAREDWLGDGLADERRHSYPLSADSIVLDLGGYKGDWTAEISRRYVCKVHVFEPVPEYADRIAERFKFNPRIFVHAFGLAVNTEVVPFKIDNDSSSAYKEGDSLMEFRAVRDYLPRRVSLMKINIEGGEYDLLGHMLAEGLVPWVDHLQVQFHHFMPDAPERAEAIRAGLLATHDLTYSYPWIFDSWSRR